MMNPLVSVIIPNLNNADRLEQCLEALMRQDFPLDQVEILVVDNGSSDQSLEISEKYPIQLLVQNEYQSPYWCRNLGIQQARGEIIALLDSNCIPKPSWLSAGVDGLQHTKSAIITGPVKFSFSPKKTIAERIDYLYSVIHAEDIPQASALPATHLFTGREVFEKVGYFIPNIRSLGDIEWTSRAKGQGVHFGFAEQAIVDYPAKQLATAIKKMIRLGGGRKELWKISGKSVFAPKWIWQVVRNFLPPSPRFYQDMEQKNRKEKTQIPRITLFLGLWGLKMCRAWGMIFKKTPNF